MVYTTFACGTPRASTFSNIVSLAFVERSLQDHGQCLISMTYRLAYECKKINYDLYRSVIMTDLM